MRFRHLAALAAALPLATLACASIPQTAQPSQPLPATTIHTPDQIVTPEFAATEPELARKGEVALMSRHFAEAARIYELLISARANSPNIADYMLSLANAYEGMDAREKARDAYRAVAERFPTSSQARAALLRAATLHAYLEEWKPLAEIADTLLKRQDIDVVDRIVGLGARALARVEQGEDDAANHDALEGLNLVDRTHYADADLLPVAAAQLRFALGEVRRVRSERITFQSIGEGKDEAAVRGEVEQFATKLEERCHILLEAQSAYEQAVRSVDLHWATMAGYRLGEMYRTLHKDLVTVVLPDSFLKTERDKQIFYAFMHIRFRRILEQGIADLRTTIQIGDNIHDESQWLTRAKSALAEMERSLVEEEAQLAKMPFKEDEVRQALANMMKNRAHN